MTPPVPDSTSVVDHTNVPGTSSVHDDPCLKSAAAKKIKLSSSILQSQSPDDSHVCSDDIDMDTKNCPSYVFFDTSIFVALINSIGKCEQCGGNVATVHNIDFKMGFCHFFKVSCTVAKCTWYIKPYPQVTKLKIKLGVEMHMT